MPHNVPAQVAANVRIELARHNMRQKELAGRIGMKPAMLSHRLQGRTDLKLHEIDLIAGALDVPVATLLRVTRQAADNSGQHSVSSAPIPPAGESESRERLDGPAARHGGESR